MKTCTRCGASAYVDADPYCEHAYHEPPMPTVEPGVIATVADRRFERGFAAYGAIGGKMHVVTHPTRNGALALWQERWTWGPAIAALFEIEGFEPGTFGSANEARPVPRSASRRRGGDRARQSDADVNDALAQVFSLERRGVPGMLRFGSAGPMLSAVRSLLEGGDPFEELRARGSR